MMMNHFLEDAMKDKLMRFMMGRYGSDPLNKAIMIVSVVLVLASSLWNPLYTVALVLMMLSVFRMFSRNIEKRQSEYFMYERAKGKFLGFFRRIKNRTVGTKTHRYFQCSSCKQQVRVPRGRGKIKIHCPKCQSDFMKRT